LGVIKRLAPYDLYFVETPIDIDDLNGYSILHKRSPVRIAAGEWQNTHHEFLDLADRGQLDVLQPDVGRVGGFTEALKVCRIAAERERLIVPHCWKSGIGIAASAHLAAACDCCPFIEFLPIELAESPLRRELLVRDLPVVDGLISLRDSPGLGIELNQDTIEKYRVD
jgi:L-alanine-DL-glutamate epimerase-like enolase superfamily enzyme